MRFEMNAASIVEATYALFPPPLVLMGHPVSPDDAVPRGEMLRRGDAIRLHPLDVDAMCELFMWQKPSPKTCTPE